MDEEQKKKFIMFENDKNVCWLNATMSLIAHNRTFKKNVESFPDSQINKIISVYDDTMTTFNKPDSGTERKFSKARRMLLELQNSTLEYLKQFQKFNSGEPDSAFCNLLSLIYKDKSNIKKQLEVKWIWKKYCRKCGTKYIGRLNPIITLSKVCNFYPDSPSSLYTCTDCNYKSEQEMKLIYKELPPCLIFHFEAGAGTGSNFPVSFSIKGREYKLTGIIILEKSSDRKNINHFFTLIRNPTENCWLECNDLQKNCVTFSPVKPEFDAKDVYVCVFEAFDNLDKIKNDEVSIEQFENVSAEVIDLSNENDSTNNSDAYSKNKATKLHKIVTNDETSKFSPNFFSKVDSLTKEFSNNKKCKPSSSMESLKTRKNDRLEESEKHSNSATNSELHLKFSSNMHESVSKTVDYQDTIEKSIKDIEFKVEITDYPKHKITDIHESVEKSNSSDRNETSFKEILKMSSKEQSSCTEKDSGVNQENISATNLRPPNKNSFDNHDIQMESDNNTCQDQFADQLKKSKVKATDNLECKIKDASEWNAKEPFFQPYVSYKNSMQKSEMCSSEMLKENNVTCNIDNQQTALTVTNSRLPNNFFPDKYKIETNSKNLNFQSKIANEFAEIERADYSGLKLTDTLIKNKEENLTSSCNSEKNEYKFTSSNSKKRQGTEDNSSSMKRKGKMATQDTTSNSSLGDGILQRAKRTLNSADSCNFEKRAKMSDVKEISEKNNEKVIEESDKQNSQSDPDIIKRRTSRSLIDSIVENTLTNFYQRIFQICENKRKET